MDKLLSYFYAIYDFYASIVEYTLSVGDVVEKQHIHLWYVKPSAFFIFSYIVIFGGLLILMNVAMFRMHRKFFKEYLQVTVLGAIRKEENLLNSIFLQPMS